VWERTNGEVEREEKSLQKFKLTEEIVIAKQRNKFRAEIEGRENCAKEDEGDSEYDEEVFPSTSG